MRDLILGMFLISIFWLIVIGCMEVSHRRELTRISSEAYAESYLTKSENKNLHREIRWLYNQRGKQNAPVQ